MGGSITKHVTQNERFINEIDLIAANLITKEKFEDLVKLTNESYCNKLVILTADVIGKKMKNRDIRYLSKVITQEGEEKTEIMSDNIFYALSSEIDDFKDGEKNKMCIGIAKFYIRIAHLFSAILATVNPKYQYELDGKIIGEPTSITESNTDIPKVPNENLYSMKIYRC